jgi:hypothetical protein
MGEAKVKELDPYGSSSYSLGVGGRTKT